jgi:hypothetical protein
MPLPASFAELQENEAVMLYLPRLEWRAEHSLTRLREVGFRNVALEAGVDSALEDARAAALVDGWRFDPGITPGEIGFSTSMLRIWQRVVDEDLAYLLVFEDDVLPHPDIDRVGQTYWDETPSDADFVFLGSRMDRTDLARLSGRVVALPTWCTHAYVVTQRGAAEGLERLRDQITRADRWPRVLDQELRRWMEDGLVRYACWNGTLLPPAFPRSDEVRGGRVLPTDVAWVDRDTGPFFQNFSLVSRDPAPPKGRAVLITPVAPTLRGDAFADRALVVLRGLRARHDVDLIVAPVFGTARVEGWVSDLARSTKVLSDSVSDPFLQRVAAMALDEQQRARIAYPRPMATRWSTSEAAEEVADFVGADVDLVYVLRVFMAPIAERMLAAGDRSPRLVIDLDQDDAAVARQCARIHRAWGDDAAADVAEIDAASYDAIADDWVPRADVVLVSAPIDATVLEVRYPGVDARVLPDSAPHVRDADDAPPVDLLFVGELDRQPYMDGARWLDDEVVPRLQSRLGAPVRVAHADARSVPCYRATTVVVVPLRAGGGARAAILEAFANRRAVVSTTCSAYGLDVLDGVHLVLADSADDFAAGCARLLEDRTMRGALVDAAFEVAIEHARPRVVSLVADLVAG